MIREFLSTLILAAASLTLSGTGSGQGLPADDEVIKIDTKLGQISMAIEQTIPEPFILEVTDNGRPVEHVSYESPKGNPLQVVIIVAMNPMIDKCKMDKDSLNEQLKTLGDNSGINIIGLNVVSDPENLGKKIKLPKSYKTARFDTLQAAVSETVDDLQKAKGTRKAILVLTNEVESLPVDVIERTNQMLGKASVMVYLMSINEKIKGVNRITRKPSKIIARSNINGDDVVIFPHDYIRGLFRSFTRLAMNLYTVSFDLPDLQVGASHKIVATAKRVRTGFAFTKNIREFSAADVEPVKPTGSLVEVAYGKKPAELAAAEIEGHRFSDLLLKRASDLTPEARDYYRNELIARPEFKNVELLPDSDERVENLVKNVTPVLDAFKRQNYTKLIVYKSEMPFVGMYRECMILISTKALELLSQEAMRAAIAHEFAHEFFIDEMREADQKDDDNLRHLVEHKCDLVAVIVTAQLKDDPFAIIEAASKISDWYKLHPVDYDLQNERSPSVSDRRVCIEEFFQYTAAHTS